jgi:2-amino-4-hydroxy-6-hydroxymethyldihydropteridine diphosphokinase
MLEDKGVKNKINGYDFMVYIGLSSNIKPRYHLSQAVAELSTYIELLEISSVWKSPAIEKNGPDFFNAAAKIKTSHTLNTLKCDVLRLIETRLGRTRSADKFAQINIDLDILIFDDQELDSDIWQYAHLAVPLAEIYPHFINIFTQQKLKQTADELRVKQSIEKQNFSLDIHSIS